MNRLITLAAVLVVPLCLESAQAQEPLQYDNPGIAGSIGYAPYRAAPDYGAGTESAGAAHYELPAHHYSTWYRPKPHEIHKSYRCLPAPWRPRGYGNLFYRRQGYRMDYAAYRLSDPRTQYGPAYYPTGANETCDCHEGKSWQHCGHCQRCRDCQDCQDCQTCNSCQNCDNGNACRNGTQSPPVDLNSVHNSQSVKVHHIGTLHR
jgi:hypothetical protein